MKMRLPNYTEVVLDTSLPFEERRAIADEILTEWGSHWNRTWELPSTKVCLDILGNFLGKEPKVKEVE